MSQQIPPAPEKLVSRSVAVGLGIICIILITGIGGVMAYYTMQINNNYSAYNDEVNTYNNYVNDHHHNDSDYSFYYNSANLFISTGWAYDQTVSQPASSYTVWNFSASYAGYVSVWVRFSNVSGTNVRVSYSSNGVNFSQEKVVNAGDTANFPILPSPSIQVEVGNSNLVGGAIETVTIAYYY